MSTKKIKKNIQETPIYKKWWFWVIIILLAVIAGGYSGVKNKEMLGDSANTSTSSSVDYTGQDAKVAYDRLIADGHSVKFVFDRNNNGGFTEDDFQDYVINDSFSLDNYEENPFVVTKQETLGNNVTLYIDYKTIVEEDNAKAEREKQLEDKLGIVESMTACEQYGARNYRNFKMHSIIGKIAEYASDDNTWLLKYYVDADGYENLTMECYVTGTSENPRISQFLIY